MEETKAQQPAGKRGKIAGQGTKKDSVTTLLFKTKNENFAELFNRTILTDTPVAPHDLEDEDIKETAFLRITKEGGGTSLVQYRDVVKGVKNGRTLAILGIENQSEIDPTMCYRVIEIDFVNYARQMQMIKDRHIAEWVGEDGKMHKPADVSDAEYMARFLYTDRVVKCMTMVIYWGEEPWRGARKFSDIFAGGADGSHTIQMELNLLDVCRMTDEEICSYTGELRTVFGFKKYARDKKKLKAFIDDNEKYFNHVSDTALDALDELTHSPELQRIRTQKYRSEGGFNVCQGIREMIEDGMKEGEKKGRQEGILETLFGLVKDGILSIADAAKRADMKVADFEKAYKSFLL